MYVNNNKPVSEPLITGVCGGQPYLTSRVQRLRDHPAAAPIKFDEAFKRYSEIRAPLPDIIGANGNLPCTKNIFLHV